MQPKLFLVERRLKRERTSQQVIEYPKFAAVHESAFGTKRTSQQRRLSDIAYIEPAAATADQITRKIADVNSSTRPEYPQSPSPRRTTWRLGNRTRRRQGPHVIRLVGVIPVLRCLRRLNPCHCQLLFFLDHAPRS
jgi:hypothetical protein